MLLYDLSVFFSFFLTRTFYEPQINHWKVLLIEAGQEATRIMDIPLVASLMQGSAINWDYKTVPMNDSCLGIVRVVRVNRVSFITYGHLTV